MPHDVRIRISESLKGRQKSEAHLEKIRLKNAGVRLCRRLLGMRLALLLERLDERSDQLASIKVIIDDVKALLEGSSL